jgi:hypothetical protein
MGMITRPRKVLFLEFNEITRAIIDPMMNKGMLPTFSKLFREGTSARPMSVDTAPHLDPWVTWVTVHTGVDRSVHGATVLEQEQDSIKAKRTWDYALDAGKTIGVFGSISAYPPRPVPGFMVPGPFAPTGDTYPKYVMPVQHLNRKYTQLHHKNAKADSPRESAKLGLELLRLGLKPETCAEIAAQLVRERVMANQHWRRVTLQPLVNYDFFESLYRRYRPDYATWHTNHAAHFMHHYWRAYDDSKFLAPSPPEEKAKYGAAVEYGYQVCDRLLARFLRWADADPNLVVVLASSMGQQPYVKDEFPDGRIVVRFKDIRRVLELVGAEGVTDVVPTMVPQWNVKVPDAEKRARLRDRLSRAELVNGPKPIAFSVTETDAILTITPTGLAKKRDDIRYFFPDCPNASPRGYALDDLFVCDTPTPKQGMHHPEGLLAFYGTGIERGLEIANTTNLDICPTMLSLMGVPIPTLMSGRVLSDAWGEREETARASSTSQPIARA